MQALLLTLTVLFVSGCLIGSENSRAKVDFDIQEPEAPPTSFAACFANTKKEHHSTLRKIKEFSFHTCKILIGHTNSKGYPQIRAIEAKKYDKYRTYRSDDGYEGVQKFMDLNHITCKKIKEEGKDYEVLRFKFPTNNVGHADYGHANLKCPHGSETKTWLNLTYYEASNTLLFDMQFGKDKKTATYHYLTTDSDGVIKRHVKVFGQQGQKTVVLDNYQLQQL